MAQAQISNVCGVLGDGDTTVATVQTMINQAVGSGRATSDLNLDDVVNVVDVQIAIDAAFGWICPATNVPTYTLTVTNGTVNGASSGTFAANTVVTLVANAPPAGQAFLSWTGLAVTNVTASTTTLNMVAYNASVQANYGPATSSAAIPFPVTTHPRLWITTADLSRLQSWATASNPIYQNGTLPVLQDAVDVYNTQFLPNGVTGLPPATPNPNYPDPGDTQGYTGYLTEEYAVVLAFNSLIDPSQANRIQYAQMARNMLMYALHQAALGVSSGAPFRDPLFATYNRANGSGEEWALAVDWIYNATDAKGNPILSASDKLTIRNAFMVWANACLTASTAGGDSPQVVNVYNSLQLLPNSLPYRMAANNYYTGHARLLTLMALAIDPADDPAVNSSLPSSNLGNSLRSYLSDALGSWLYQQYAMYQDGATVAAQYGIPGNGAGFGLASGGLPPEGMLYGVSYGNLLGGLLGLQTAGFNDPTYAGYTGPQIGLLNAPMWDRYVQGTISSLIPAPIFPTGDESYLGQVYQFASYGDLLRFYVTPDYAGPFTLLALLQQKQGNTTNLNNAIWFDYNIPEGGPAGLYSEITDVDGWGTMGSILYFLLFDPSVNPASLPDPRPTYPTIFLDAATGRLVAHSDWTATGNMFSYRASWESINHQQGDAGQFELYRKGEWLTKGLTNYDDNGYGQSPYYHNSLGLQNTSANRDPASLIQYWEAGTLAYGGQWWLGDNAGDPSTSFSNGPGYVYAATNMTNLYNKALDIWSPSSDIDDITQATRSILWLNNDYIVVYDRATSSVGNLFKRWNLALIANPAINGHVAAETLPSGQQLFVQSLLPSNGAIAAVNGLSELTTVAELEPAQFIMTVQDPSNPVDTRFLDVLQGADAGAAMVPATYVQSTSGTPFDGAVFGSTAVYFPVNVVGSSVTTTLPAPAGVHTALVTGLARGGSYTVSIGGNKIAITSGSGSTADAAGLLRLTF